MAGVCELYKITANGQRNKANSARIRIGYAPARISHTTECMRAPNQRNVVKLQNHSIIRAYLIVFPTGLTIATQIVQSAALFTSVAFHSFATSQNVAHLYRRPFSAAGSGDTTRG